MKKLCVKIFFAVCMLTAVFADGVFAETTCTGWTYYDSDLDSCVTCENQGFTITTTSLSANKVFWFELSAKGGFAVDWGDGTINYINHDDTEAEEHTHTYTTSGVRTIKFCGKATEYNDATGDNVVPAITFNQAKDSQNRSGSQTYIASVAGSLGSVFPTLGANANQQPRFRGTFQNANHLTTIPANLFSGVSGSADGMFRSTFDKCTLLSAIPYGLFANATGGAPNMFRSTFYECTSLHSLPEDLFAGINVAAHSEFKFTLFGTTGLAGQYIPASTFTGLINATPTPHPNAADMWDRTFDVSTGEVGLVKSCPERTHQFITGYEGNSVASTWDGHVSCEPNNSCTGATYWDSTNEVCEPCPSGYVDDLSATKESEDQCKIHCPAGQYLANAGDTTCTNAAAGYYAGASDVAYGSTSTPTQCPYGMSTLNNITGATSEDQCIVYCFGTTYRDASDNTCVPCPSGYDSDAANGKTADTDCKIYCEGGTYLATAHAPSCINVGDGFYASESTVAYGGTSTRTSCQEGQMTGMVNATSASQCFELCTGATYKDSNTGECVPCPVGYDAHTLSGKTSDTECQIHCVAGTYIASANDTVCTNVGDGYYASSSNVNYGSVGSRTQCPNGHLTGTQTATDASQCLTSCTGATYYDSTSGQCENCPTGYTDNQTNGKNSINQCQHYCAAGTIFEIYTPIEYLESRNGKQFIDTKYGITSDHVNGTVVIENLVTQSSSTDAGNFFGNIYGPGGFSSGWKKGVFGVWIQNTSGGGEKARYTAALTANQTYTIQYDVTLTANDNKKNGVATLQVDNNAQQTKIVPNVDISDIGNTIKLFTNGTAVKNGNQVTGRFSDKLFQGRMRSLQLYDNDVLKLDLIPVRRESDGELGMYNRVNGDFYTNAGLDSFVAGADSDDSFVTCSAVGNGYYIGANYTNYGSTATRNQCPNGAATMKNGEIIDRATSIYQCDGVTTCTGATYPDPTTGICTSCPTGYGYNSQNGKESVYECQIHCLAGTYLENANDATCVNVGNGYYASDSLVNWGDVGTRTRCANSGATNKENAEDASECIAVAACTGATYMNLGVCLACPAGYDANTTSGKEDISECQIVCPEGTYLATANGTTCTDAGVGYWATGGAVNYGSTSNKTACASGLTTVGYGHGADELADCGRILHLGNYVLYSKTTKPTIPAINIRPENENTVYYVGASDTDHTLTPVHISQGHQQYTAFDDSILYGERDFETNTRIQQ